MNKISISDILPDPLLVIDAGGRDGFGMLPSFRSQMCIHSFEPDKSSVPSLRKFANDHSFASFTIHETALSDETGESIFFRTLHPSMSSLLEPDPEAYKKSYNAMPDHEKWMENMKPVEKISVKTETLDSFAKQQNIQRIDLFKLDTQGAELKILNGSKELLNEKKIGLIFCEVLFIPTYKGHPVFSEIDLFLRSKGYRFIDLRIYPEVLDRENRVSLSGKLTEQPKYCIGGDAVYIPEFDADSDVNFIKRAALLLSGLGYYSDSKHLLRTFCGMNENEAEEFQRECAKGNSKSRFKLFLKRWTPPAILNLYSRNKK